MSKVYRSENYVDLFLCLSSFAMPPATRPLIKEQPMKTLRHQTPQAVMLH
jgi:hypothetical protein